jgi:hypothetical protein
MANSSTVSSGDLATATQYNNLRADAIDTSSGHIHDGTNARADGQFSLAVAGLPMIIENTTDAVQNEVLRLRGDNGTRDDGDEIFLSFYLDDDGGNSHEFARITGEATDVSNGNEDGQIRFGVSVAGTITDVFTINASTGGATSMTLDVSGDLTLDADGGDIIFKDGGTTFGSATNTGGNLILKSGTTTAATFSGANVTLAGTVGSGAITSSGIIKTDDTTEATSTTDGSLQTDGGLSVVKDAVFGDDVFLLSDSAVFNMGAGSDFTITHDGTTGATLAGTPITVNSTGALTLDSSTDITLDADGADVFLKDGGTLFGTFTNSSGELVIKSSSSGTTAATFSGANVTLAGTVGSGAITSSGIIKTDDATDATSTTDGSLQTDGGLSVVKDAVFGDDVFLLTDSSVLGLGAGKDFTITHDGTTGATLAGNPITITASGASTWSTSSGALTITSAAALNLNPASGSVILLDGTINVDAGVVTGATSVTSTAFVGDITGDVTGNADTATALATARTIGGTSFDGTANIAVALSATTTALASARTIGGTSFDGTGNIAVALSTEATNVTSSANNSANETVYPTFVDGATGTQGIETDTGLTYNPSTGVLTTTSVTGNLTGTVATATQNSITTMTGLVTTGATTVGALNAGSITSGFTSIDVGSGALTTTGTASAGILDVGTYGAIGTDNGFGPDAKYTLIVDRNHTITAGGAGLKLSGEITVNGGDIQDVAHAQFGGGSSALIITSGNDHTAMSTLLLMEPAITETNGTVVTASTLHIRDAPTEGDNNYAINVDGGNTRLFGALMVGGPTGGMPGTIGHINAIEIFADNTQISDWVFEEYYAKGMELTRDSRNDIN